LSAVEPEYDPRAEFARARAEWRRRRRKAMELHGRRCGERDAYLLAQLEPKETVVATGQALVTDRRVLFAWRVGLRPGPRDWTHDALTFQEITRWTVGRRHDHRPVLQLEHPTHVRVEHTIAHRFLWFGWGNAEREVPHGATTFYFSSRRDPVFRAMKGRLELSKAAQGDPFVETLPGTREERVRGSRGVLYVDSGPFRSVTRLRRRLATLDEHLHRGQITWWIRAASWLLLAVPAWFIRPWLVVPAILLVEGAWIAGLQWSWHRDRRRVPLPEDYW
jgi:hypothetical protein